MGLYLLNTDMCWWRWWWGLWFCRKADYLRKGWDLICWNGLPLNWEVLLKGLPDAKYLGGGKEDHKSTGGIFQQTEEGGWHDTDVLSWGLNYVLEPDILECEVKWAVGSITTNKASGDDRIPAELFQILKMMLLKCCTQYARTFGKVSSGHRTGKGQFPFQSLIKAMPKNAQTTAQLHSSHTLVT